MTELIRLLRGHHEPQEEKVFHELLKYVSAKGTMIELGSFWSYYSLWFQRSVPEAKTFMVTGPPQSGDREAQLRLERTFRGILQL